MTITNALDGAKKIGGSTGKGVTDYLGGVSSMIQPVTDDVMGIYNTYNPKIQTPLENNMNVANYNELANIGPAYMDMSGYKKMSGKDIFIDSQFVGAAEGAAAGMSLGPWGALGGAISGNAMHLWKDLAHNNAGMDNYKSQVNSFNTRQIQNYNNNLTSSLDRLNYDYIKNQKVNYAAFGGNLFTQNSGPFTEIKNGGSHEENPYGGVPQGFGSNGKQNLVEQGEVKYNDFIFSKRIYPSKEVLNQFKIPTKYFGLSTADIAKKFNLEAKERPSDPISNTGQDTMLNRLQQAQEYQKVVNEAEKNGMTPEQYMQAMQQQSQQQPQEQQNSFAEGGLMDGPGDPPVVADATRVQTNNIPYNHPVNQQQAVEAFIQEYIKQTAFLNAQQINEFNQTLNPAEQAVIQKLPQQAVVEARNTYVDSQTGTVTKGKDYNATQDWWRDFTQTQKGGEIVKFINNPIINQAAIMASGGTALGLMGAGWANDYGQGASAGEVAKNAAFDIGTMLVVGRILNGKAVTPMSNELGFMNNPFLKASLKPNIQSPFKPKQFKVSNNSMTRGIGGETGIQDFVTSGVVRGNPNGRLISPKDISKFEKHQVWKDFKQQYPEAADELVANSLSEKNYNIVKQVFGTRSVFQQKSSPSILKNKTSRLDKFSEEFPTYRSYQQQDKTKNWFPDTSSPEAPKAFWFKNGQLPANSSYPSKYFIKLKNSNKYEPYTPEGNFHPTTKKPVEFRDPNVEIYETVEKNGKTIYQKVSNKKAFKQFNTDPNNKFPFWTNRRIANWALGAATVGVPVGFEWDTQNQQQQFNFQQENKINALHLIENKIAQAKYAKDDVTMEQAIAEWKEAADTYQIPNYKVDMSTGVGLTLAARGYVSNEGVISSKPTSTTTTQTSQGSNKPINTITQPTVDRNGNINRWYNTPQETTPAFVNDKFIGQNITNTKTKTPVAGATQTYTNTMGGTPKPKNYEPIDYNSPKGQEYMQRYNSVGNDWDRLWEDWRKANPNSKYSLAKFKELAHDNKYGPVHAFIKGYNNTAQQPATTTESSSANNTTDLSGMNAAPGWDDLPEENITLPITEETQSNNWNKWKDAAMFFNPARLAPLFNDMYNLYNQEGADPTLANSIRGAYTPIQAEQFGQAMAYDPYDWRANEISQRAKAQSAQQAMMNIAGGNTAAATANLALQNTINQGDIAANYKQGLEYNNANRANVLNFNNQLDQANSMNRQQVNQYNNANYMNSLVNSAQVWDQEKKLIEQTRGQNQNMFAQNLGGLGQDYVNYNMIQSNPYLLYSLMNQYKGKQ